MTSCSLSPKLCFQMLCPVRLSNSMVMFESFPNAKFTVILSCAGFGKCSGQGHLLGCWLFLTGKIFPYEPGIVIYPDGITLGPVPIRIPGRVTCFGSLRCAPAPCTSIQVPPYTPWPCQRQRRRHCELSGVVIMCCGSPIAGPISLPLHLYRYNGKAG